MGQSASCREACQHSAGWPADVLGGLLHLGPPAVVGVADQQQDLTPEQHKCGVCGDHAAHTRVQALQAVETAVGTVGGEESRGSCCNPPEHS